MLWATARVVWLLSYQWSVAVPTSGDAETWVEGASGGPPREEHRRAGYGMGERLPGAIPDRDHRGMG